MLVQLLLCALLLANCSAYPTIFAESGRPYCVAVEAPQDTVIRVLYSAPDISLDKHDENYSPTFLSIHVHPASRVTDTKLHTAPILNRLKPTNLQLEQREGSIEHAFEVDGRASICFKSTSASHEHPQRFGIRVQKTSSDALKKAVATDLDGHLSHMEVELKRISSGMRAILREADFSKERDAIFHQQTLSMHSATIFWPIVKVCVLIMTGFTQASHIVRFFQSRRII